MRRQTPIAHQLYAYLFPRPTSNDPPTFSAHLARNLVPEVRIEVATFYGDLNSAEARYPGLNYCHPPHRMRLGRFKHHRRLFDAFDTLGLTYNEVQDFCCWEGTKWARERYEKDEGVTVIDTTGDEIGPYVDRRELRNAAEQQRRQSITRKTDIEVIVEEAQRMGSSVSRRQLPPQPVEEDEEEMNDADSEGEDDSETVHEAQDLNAPQEQHATYTDRRRVDQAVTQRIISAYQQGLSLPPEIEQYLKEQCERGASEININDGLSSVLSRQLSSGYRPLRRSASSTSSFAINNDSAIDLAHNGSTTTAVAPRAAAQG
jgi:hypothetical protein